MPEIGDVLTLSGALLAGGAGFGGFAMLLRRTDVRLEKHIDADEKHALEVIDRLARIETILMERKNATQTPPRSGR